MKFWSLTKSRDATPQIVQSYLQRPAAQNRLRYLRQTRATGRSAGRNQGILESSGEVVMILNADVLLPTDFLQRIAVHYQAGADYVVVYSQVANIEHLLPHAMCKLAMIYIMVLAAQRTKTRARGFRAAGGGTGCGTVPGRGGHEYKWKSTTAAGWRRWLVS